MSLTMVTKDYRSSVNNDCLVLLPMQGDYVYFQISYDGATRKDVLTLPTLRYNKQYHKETKALRYLCNFRDLRYEMPKRLGSHRDLTNNVITTYQALPVRSDYLDNHNDYCKVHRHSPGFEGLLIQYPLLVEIMRGVM